MSALQEIDFSSNLSLPYVNHLTLPLAKVCEYANPCPSSVTTCKFNSFPALDCTGNNSGTSVLNVGAIIGIIIVILCFLGLVAYLVTRTRRRHNSSLLTHRDPDGNNPSSLWVEKFDEKSGARFWMNTATEEFSWTPPSHSGFGPVVREVSSKSLSIDSKSWKEFTDDTAGNKYWMKPATREFFHENFQEPTTRQLDFKSEDPESFSEVLQTAKSETGIRKISSAPLRRSLNNKREKEIAVRQPEEINFNIETPGTELSHISANNNDDAPHPPLTEEITMLSQEEDIESDPEKFSRKSLFDLPRNRLKALASNQNLQVSKFWQTSSDSSTEKPDWQNPKENSTVIVRNPEESTDQNM